MTPPSPPSPVSAPPSAPSPSESSSAASSVVTVDKRLFWTRLCSLWRSWQSPHADSSWSALDSLLLITGAVTDSETFSKLTAVQLWLFGYEIPDSAFLIQRDQLVIVTSSKKRNILEHLKEPDPELLPNQKFHLLFIEVDKANMYKANIQALVEHMQREDKTHRIGEVPTARSSSNSRNLGYCLTSALKELNLEIVDISPGLSSCLNVADEMAKKYLTKAGEISTKMFKYFLENEIESAIDEDKSVNCADLAESMEKAIQAPSRVGINDINASDVDFCYSPIIQSGGPSGFNLKPSATTPNELLNYEDKSSIIVQCGARYHQYCSNMGRTYFINPSKEQKNIYRVLIKAYLEAKAACKPGTKAKLIYLNAYRAIQQSGHPHLLEHFVKNVGFCIGLEFCDTVMLLNENNPRLIQTGMAINLCVGFSDLHVERPDGSTKVYAALISDTLLVGASETSALTNMPRDITKITYLLGDETGTETNGEDSALTSARRTRNMQKGSVNDKANLANEKARAEHQAQLAQRQREIALKKLAGEQGDGTFRSQVLLDANDRVAYESPLLTSAAKANKIFVDVASEALILPIHDQLVPFNISTVKNVQKQEEGSFNTLRITFHIPDTKQPLPMSDDGQTPLRFVSELTYRSQSDTLDKVYFGIRELRKHVQMRIREQEAKSSLVEQADLIVLRDPLQLKDVMARPQLSRKRATGTLQAHGNGLRYITTDKSKVDVLFSNIKACFYQPAQDSHQVLLHFELKNAILIDKSKTKKTTYLQVYYEVVDMSEDLGAVNRYRDEDGLIEEQQERRRRHRWNQNFLTFVKGLEQISAEKDKDNKLEFDIPYAELAFTGVPEKAAVDIMPTVYSLVALDDVPPTVLMLNEVEIAVFERVQFGLKNFDLVFVFKDFMRPPSRIDSIPIKFLKSIQSWLDSCDIVYYESAQNLLWKAVMKQINSDIEDFWRDGGWSFLSDRPKKDGEPDSDSEIEQESEFEPESSEAEDDDDSEEYDTASSENDDSGDDSDDGSTDGDSDSKGDSWDDLERIAKKEDVERKTKARAKGNDFSDDDSDDGGRLVAKRPLTGSTKGKATQVRTKQPEKKR